MKLSICQVPYDSGHLDERMGRGPRALVEGALLTGLRSAGHDVEVEEFRLSAGFRTETGTAVDLQRRVAAHVRAARAAGRLPLVFTGNCYAAAFGVAGALEPGTAGVLWFDAHGDLNTPETSPSGFFDGMAYATLTGNCWKKLVRAFDGFHPIPEEHCFLIGARDLDPEEEAFLERSPMQHVRVADVRGSMDAFGRQLDTLSDRAEKLYIHLDLDVLDPEVLRANPYAAPGGLSLDELLAILAAAGERFDIFAVGVTAYDPRCDSEGKAHSVIRRVVDVLVAPAEP